MRTVAMLTVAGLLAVGVGWSAMPAGASAPAKDSKFCSTTKKLADEIDALPANSTGVDKKAAAETNKKIKEAAQTAPKKIKKAMLTLASVYGRVAKGESVTTVLADSIVDYAKAASTFAAYYFKTCVKTP